MNEHVPQQNINKKFTEEAQDPHALEQRKRQEFTIATVAQAAERLGIWQDLYLLGGFASRARSIAVDRAHDDIDFVVQGRASAEKLLADILASGKYEVQESPGLKGTSIVYLKPKVYGELEFIDFRWVNEEKDSGGSSIYLYEFPNSVKQTIGGKVGLPASAFSQNETLEFLGTKVKYIFPEYSFLAKGSSPKEKDRFDQGAMSHVLDKEKLIQISRDAKSAGILINVPPGTIASVKTVIEDTQ